MTLEEVHYKLSAMPAKVLGLHNRGTLTEGQAADLFIYGYDKLGFQRLRYEIVPDLPDGDWRRVCKPEGIDLVMVNGETTFINGTDCTGALPGRLVGSGGAKADEMLMYPMAIAAE
jgi:N-acyl-D-amino-acid deacylase